MPTYLIFSKWTEQGIRNIKESPKRLELGKQKLKDLGGEIKAFYLTLGDDDMVAVAEAPDDETLARHLLWLGSQGSVTTKTVKVFTEDEYRRIVAKVA